MDVRGFVEELSRIELPNVFNPYFHQCGSHDLLRAPIIRRKNLRDYLYVVEQMQIDTLWMGRDLGYRGGRRTGLALTDEYHLPLFGRVYPGSEPKRATKGQVVVERTAAEIWSVLRGLDRPPLLWNVFPFHPYESGNELTNRRFLKRELQQVSDLNRQLISSLGIRRIICVGRDSAEYARALSANVLSVRHPSFGGTREFREGMQRIYGARLLSPQVNLF